MNSPDTFNIDIPQQELDRSSFFASNAAAVTAWVEKLPMTDIGKTTQCLFQALTELNKVRLLPAERLAMLNTLRTPVYYASNALGKHFLNQPIALPEKPRKVADLDNELHRLLATGYLIVASHAIVLAGDNHSVAKALIAPALHRVITQYSRNIQRQLQLYKPVNSNNWRELHQVYCTARLHGVLDHMVEDAEFGHCSVEQSYIRVLLLGSSKPNQLRQDDLERLFKPATAWAAKCTLETNLSNSLFLVDLQGEKQPVYSELQTDANGPQWIGLNTEALSEHLLQARLDADPGKLHITIDNCPVSNDLLNHVILAWSKAAHRSSRRQANGGQLVICAGLSSTHHFLSGGANFTAMISESGQASYSVDNENLFMSAKPSTPRPKDLWDSAFETTLEKNNPALKSIDYQIQENKSKAQSVDTYHSYRVTMINTSDTGYCIALADATEAPVKAGEIIGVKEAGDKDWIIAVIRWVSHNGNDQTHLGIERISTKASALGARIMAKKGDDNDYMRAILIPDNSAVSHPDTLLTQRFPFKSGQKVVLNHYGKRRQVKLGAKLNVIGAYNQFEIHDVAMLQQQIDENSAVKDEFDSLWTQL